MESKLGGEVEEDVGWDIVGRGASEWESIDMWSATHGEEIITHKLRMDLNLIILRETDNSDPHTTSTYTPILMFGPTPPMVACHDA